MCSLKVGSVFQKTDLEYLTTFSWAEVEDEFATYAPTFLSFVNGCLPSVGDKMHHDAILGFVSAVLLNPLTGEYFWAQQLTLFKWSQQV